MLPAPLLLPSLHAGCACNPSRVDCHSVLKESQLFLHSFTATPSSTCVFSVTILRTTTSGEHKVDGATHLLGRECSADASGRSFLLQHQTHVTMPHISLDWALQAPCLLPCHLHCQPGSGLSSVLHPADTRLSACISYERQATHGLSYFLMGPA